MVIPKRLLSMRPMGGLHGATIVMGINRTRHRRTKTVRKNQKSFSDLKRCKKLDVPDAWWQTALRQWHIYIKQMLQQPVQQMKLFGELLSAPKVGYSVSCNLEPPFPRHTLVCRKHFLFPSSISLCPTNKIHRPFLPMMMTYCYYVRMPLWWFKDILHNRWDEPLFFSRTRDSGTFLATSSLCQTRTQESANKQVSPLRIISRQDRSTNICIYICQQVSGTVDRESSWQHNDHFLERARWADSKSRKQYAKSMKEITHFLSLSF